MRKNWKKGAAALLSAVLAMSGIFSAGTVYADEESAVLSADPMTGSFGPDSDLWRATASDASVSAQAKGIASYEASSSDAFFD